MHKLIYNEAKREVQEMCKKKDRYKICRQENQFQCGAFDDLIYSHLCRKFCQWLHSYIIISSLHPYYDIQIFLSNVGI